MAPAAPTTLGLWPAAWRHFSGGAQPRLGSASQLVYCGLRRARCFLESVSLDRAHGSFGAECRAYQPQCLCMEVRVRGSTFWPVFCERGVLKVRGFALQQMGRVSTLQAHF